jgi:glycosyltransferase involved in cell wall biosynthesis
LTVETGPFKLCILIPVLNEVKLIDNALEQLSKQIDSQIQVVVSDPGSTDGSIEKIEQITQNRSQWMFINSHICAPSIAKTVVQAIPLVQAPLCLILPIDCSMTQINLKEFIEQSRAADADYGCFYKTYHHTSYLLRPYAGIQNLFRTRWLKNMVWTNGIWLKTSILKNPRTWSTPGFLEDVILSDHLKKYKAKIYSSPIRVSARLYQRDRIIKRIVINAFIISLYRLSLWMNCLPGMKQWPTIEELRKLYRRV